LLKNPNDGRRRLITMSTSKPGKLVWMDLEMTGLDPKVDEIIEIATIITDENLEIIAHGPELVIHQGPERFDKMDQWNREHHTKSGLWQKVLDSKVSCAQAEAMTLDFLKEHISENESPLCGNSIWQDRRFLCKYMTDIEDYLHYRIVDVSTIKELAARWYPKRESFVAKKNSHRALDDILESIDELAYYRKNFFIP